MTESTLALGDLITAIPTLYYQLQLPLAVIMLIVGAASGAMSLHKGIGKAAGKVVGSVALASLVFGGLSLTQAINQTVDTHSGQPILTSFYTP
jgi:sulfopyruvate decarboxylase TPP-binding subunit